VTVSCLPPAVPNAAPAGKVARGAALVADANAPDAFAALLAGVAGIAVAPLAPGTPPAVVQDGPREATATLGATVRMPVSPGAGDAPPAGLVAPGLPVVAADPAAAALGAASAATPATAAATPIVEPTLGSQLPGDLLPATLTAPLSLPAQAPSPAAAHPTQPAPAEPPAPTVQAEHPAHPAHPAHPVHPMHPMHPMHPNHPVQAEHAKPSVPAETPELPATTTQLAPTSDSKPALTPDQPLPVAVPVSTTPTLSTAPVTSESPQAVGDTGPARHVRPALLEAARHLKTEGGRTSLVIRLDPPELGAVLVRLTVRDGQVDVQLRTPDAAARSDLQAQSFDVQQVLREQGLDLSSFDVRHGESFTAGDRPAGETPDRGTPRRGTRADGQPHTSHVMDDVSRPQSAGTWL
jgi:hypothetical protein